MKNIARALGLVMLALSIGACGGRTDSPQSSQANADEKPGSSAQTAGRPEQPAKPATPATMDEVIQAIDLRQLPKLAGAKVQIAKGYELYYSAPGRLTDAAALYRNKLSELGWTEDETPIPGVDPEKYVLVKFDKAGFCVYFSANLSDKKGIIDVHLSNSGNVDSRLLPQLTDAKPTISNRNYVSYKTAAKPEAVIDFYRKEITARGWKEHRVANAKFHAKEGRLLLGFDNNAMDLLFNIEGEKEGQTAVGYFVSVRDKPVRAAAKDLPKPATLDEGKKIIDLNRFPRMEGAAPGQGSSALLQYDAPGSAAQALSFYRQKLEAQGWTEEPGNHEDDEIGIAQFAKAGFQLHFFLGKGDQAGRVRIHIENKGNVDARLLPQLADAPEGELGSFDMVHYDTETPNQAAVDFYCQELSKQGWKELKSDSKVYPDGSKSLAFSQNAMLLKVEVGPNADGGNNVRLEPQLYGEIIPRPGNPEVARGMIDLRKFPRLGGAPRANASAAAVHYATSGKVSDATKFYRKELFAKGWSEQMPPLIENDDRATLRFGKRGFILEVSILTLDGGPGVGISVDNRGDLNTRKLLHLEDAKLDSSSVQEHARYTTSAMPDAAVEFYRREMPKFGWEESKTPGDSRVQLDGIYLVFVQKGMKLQIQVCANAERKTDVQVQSWVIDEAASSDKGKTARPQANSADKANVAGPRPKEFPIPDDAVEAEFEALTKTVQFKSPSTIPKLMEFYRKELKPKDWSEDNKQQIPVLGEIGLCTFKKGKASLTITLNRDGDMTAVTVLTQGVEWK